MEYDRSDQVRSIVEDHAETLKNRGDIRETDGELRPT